MTIQDSLNRGPDDSCPTASLPEGVELRVQTSADFELVDSFTDWVFGPGRFAKTAYRLRDGNPPVEGLGHLCMCDGRIIGSIIFSHITIGEAPALLLGPLAVSPIFKNRGVGLALMRAGLAAAASAGHELVILVGDLPYYQRAGFAPVPPGQMLMPGPVDPARLLACQLIDGALDQAKGSVRPAPRLGDHGSS